MLDVCLRVSGVYVCSVRVSMCLCVSSVRMCDCVYVCVRERPAAEGGESLEEVSVSHLRLFNAFGIV